MKLLPLVLGALVVCGGATLAAEHPRRPLNLLLITVDDMSADSIGAFGCKLPGTTPNIDRLAAQGMRFNYAHVVVGNCMPSRNVMWSGRYPHNTGVEGFYQVKDARHPHLMGLMKSAGYFTGIRGKVSHSTPYSPYGWDIELDALPDGTKAHPKDAASYRVSAERGIAAAKQAGKPFCLLLNVSDPHKPFYAEGRRGETIPDPHVPSRVFTPDEVPVPGFLFDDPVVRKELSHYYSSVRRADDCVAGILAALKASGEADRTVILFLSDHGMALPFAKTQVYHHSSNTPLFFIWPGVTKPGAVDNRHLVSAVDLLPTLLDITGIKHPPGFDGRSFAALLQGGTQEGRDFVIKEYNENAGASRDPMRAIQTRDFLYIFNPWSNGKRIMATATTGTPTYRRMAELAKTDTAIAARHELYQHRVLEEVYAIDKDPDALHNLVNHVQPDQLKKLRGMLEDWMVKTGDPMLEVFRRRNDAEFRQTYMDRLQKEAGARRAESGKGKGKKKARMQATKSDGAPAPKPRTGLIRLEVPESVKAGQTVTVKVRHHLTADLGGQFIHVTLKAGTEGKRVDRKVVKVTGEGVLEISFEVPKEVPGNTVSFAAFIGEDYPRSLQRVQTGAVPAR